MPQSIVERSMHSHSDTFPQGAFSNFSRIKEREMPPKIYHFIGDKRVEKSFSHMRVEAASIEVLKSALIEDITHRIASANSVSSLLKETLGEIRSIFPDGTEPSRISLLLLDSKKGEFEIKAALGIAHRIGERIKIEDAGISSYVIEHKEPLFIPDVSASEFNIISNKLSARAAVSVPLIAFSDPIGVLNLAGDHISTGQFDIIRRTAPSIALALKNASLIDKRTELAMTDDLTGVGNHRYFQARLDEEAKRADRYKSPLSLAMVDIDHFKSYNDKYGHQKGDAILQEVAQTIREQIRPSDHLARYGGEEFVLILSETRKHEALKTAERIRKAVKEKGVTITIGIAEYIGNKLKLVKDADTALYKGKRAGRNRTIIYEEKGIKHERNQRRLIKPLFDVLIPSFVRVK